MSARRSREDLLAAVRDAVSVVLDPCSVHNGTRMTFADLGMIANVDVDGRGRATIELVLDDPVCVYMVQIVSSLRAAALAVDGVEAADVEILGDVLWVPDRMTPEATARTAAWDAARRQKLTLPLTPVTTG